MTPQQEMQSALEKIGLPYKELKCYGSQIMVTVISEETAKKWRSVLAKLSPEKLRMGASVAYNKVNQNTNLCPTVHKVWNVWASL